MLNQFTTEELAMALQSRLAEVTNSNLRDKITMSQMIHVQVKKIERLNGIVKSCNAFHFNTGHKLPTPLEKWYGSLTAVRWDDWLRIRSGG